MSDTIATLRYETKGMPFRRLGSSGLRVPVLSIGGWLTFGGTVVGDPVKEIIKIAFENGINMIDNAESYSGGKSEAEIGRVIKELGIRRTDLVITTKVWWGTHKGPNDTGLSRKHIIEGLKASLQRLQVDYVDVVLAHRPDSTVPMEEIVRAFNWVINQGWAFYWGTSEWSAHEIEEAFCIAEKHSLMPPIVEQSQHHMFHREHPEKEYLPLRQKYGLGNMAWSPLAYGLLTGKYNNGIPEDSRFHHYSDFFKDTIAGLNTDEGRRKIEKVKKLTEFAETELKCSITHLALAWVIKQPITSTVVLGASKPEQVLDNLKALEVVPKLTDDVMAKIEEILDNAPSMGSKGNATRPKLDEWSQFEQK